MTRQIRTIKKNSKNKRKDKQGHLDLVGAAGDFLVSEEDISGVLTDGSRGKVNTESVVSVIRRSDWRVHAFLVCQRYRYVAWKGVGGGGWVGGGWGVVELDGLIGGWLGWLILKLEGLMGRSKSVEGGERWKHVSG